MQFVLKNKAISGYKFRQRTWYKTLHLGVDWKARLNILYAPTDGRVVKTVWGKQGGNWLYFKDKYGYTHRFAHLNKFLVKGGNVKEGDKLAITGNTGAYTTGYHLHHDITRPGYAVNWNKINSFIDPEWYFKNYKDKIIKPKSMNDKSIKRNKEIRDAIAKELNENWGDKTSSKERNKALDFIKKGSDVKTENQAKQIKVLEGKLSLCKIENANLKQGRESIWANIKKLFNK